VHWIWDEEKNRTNKRDHGLSFEAAQLVFSDPEAASRPDPHPDGDRWQTLGQVGTGRIISARKATPHERKAYEEGEF
jgi:uncharacterized DUF497 family protein